MTGIFLRPFVQRPSIAIPVDICCERHSAGTHALKMFLWTTIEPNSQTWFFDYPTETFVGPIVAGKWSVSVVNEIRSIATPA
jgi:hypothetical protein